MRRGCSRRGAGSQAASRPRPCRCAGAPPATATARPPAPPSLHPPVQHPPSLHPPSTPYPHPPTSPPGAGIHLHAGPHGRRRHGQHRQHHPVGPGVARVKAQRAAVVVADALQNIQRLLGGDLLRAGREGGGHSCTGEQRGSRSRRGGLGGRQGARITHMPGPGQPALHTPHAHAHHLAPPPPTCFRSMASTPMSSSSPLGCGNSAMMRMVPCSRR